MLPRFAREWSDLVVEKSSPQVHPNLAGTAMRPPPAPNLQKSSVLSVCLLGCNGEISFVRGGLVKNRETQSTLGMGSGVLGSLGHEGKGIISQVGGGSSQ